MERSDTLSYFRRLFCEPHLIILILALLSPPEALDLAAVSRALAASLSPMLVPAAAERYGSAVATQHRATFRAAYRIMCPRCPTLRDARRVVDCSTLRLTGPRLSNIAGARCSMCIGELKGVPFSVLPCAAGHVACAHCLGLLIRDGDTVPISRTAQGTLRAIVSPQRPRSGAALAWHAVGTN